MLTWSCWRFPLEKEDFRLYCYYQVCQCHYLRVSLLTLATTSGLACSCSTTSGLAYTHLPGNHLLGIPHSLFWLAKLFLNNIWPFGNWITIILSDVKSHSIHSKQTPVRLIALANSTPILVSDPHPFCFTSLFWLPCLAVVFASMSTQATDDLELARY